MSPIQQMMLGVGASEKTYLDDVFSTNLYTGNNGSGFQSITNGIDFTNEGGLVWIKNRDGTNNHQLYDTVRGAGKSLATNNAAAFVQEGSNLGSLGLANFYSVGYRIGMIDNTNKQGDDFTNFSFRKAKGFFDVVTYTGNGSSSGRQIAHSLGSVPGCIIVKCTTASNNWAVYHRGTDSSIPENYGLNLNNTNARVDNEYYWHDTKPTSTHFTIRDNANVNANGETYVAYLFGGGESTNALATSVDFTNTGSGQGQVRAGTAGGALEFGTGDFTIECWVKPTNLSNSQECILDAGNNGSNNADCVYFVYNQNRIILKSSNAYYNEAVTTNDNDQWMHVAACRSGTNLRIFKNGTLLKTVTNSTDMKSGSNLFFIGKASNVTMPLTGSISNLRVVKGQALYTSSFRPSTEPLTTTSQGATASNVKLLCCQGSTPAAATVTPYALTAYYATSSTDSPFDDPAGFVFGDSKGEVIKCGSYIGTGGSGVPPVIHLGWEPQWLMVRRVDSGGSWYIMDSMRGWGANASNNGPATIDSNTANEEENWGQYNYDLWTRNPAGFTVGPSSLYNVNNTTNGRYVWMAIRRPDGYVGKPVETGTSVFAMDTGGSGTFPEYDSGFPVDMGFLRTAAGASSTYLATRMVALTELVLNNDAAETTQSKMQFDHQAGYIDYNFSSNTQAWMWKRHAGFDVVAYRGDGVAGRQIPHSLNKTPEMMWVKRRTNGSGGTNWLVYHKGLNGGSSPEDYYLLVNENSAETATTAIWNDTAPTSTHFTLGNNSNVNQTDKEALAFLFATTAVSKVGYYTGTGSSHTITTGFQPRFIFFKQSNSSGSWKYYDTLRTTSNPFTKQIFFDVNHGPDTVSFLSVSSTGFTLADTNNNGSGDKWLYYAHA